MDAKRAKNLELLYATAAKLKRSIAPGDVLYSSISLSTYFASHAGIVGEDGLIYHAHPAGGFRENLPTYLSRHKRGGSIILLRPIKGAQSASQWAMTHINQMNRYGFNRTLSNLSINYCTKFVWQAFFHGAGIDISDRSSSDADKRWIFPRYIKHSTAFETLAVHRLEHRL